MLPATKGIFDRLTRRGRLMTKRACDRQGHVVRRGRFLFRTPTACEYAAAVSCGSYPAAQRWLGLQLDSIFAVHTQADALLVVPGTVQDSVHTGQQSCYLVM